MLSSWITTRLTTAVVAWVRWCRQWRWLVLSLVSVISAGSLYYTASYLSINTDTADMISPDLDWRQAFIAYQRAFPNRVDTLLLVVDGPTPTAASRAATRLAKALAKEHTLVQWAQHLEGDRFFDQYGLLYLSVDELSDRVDKLIEVQPVIGSLARDPSLVGLAKLLADTAQAIKDGTANVATSELVSFLNAMQATIRAQREGRRQTIDWQGWLGGDDVDESSRHYVTVKARLDYSYMLPAGAVIEHIRRLINDLELTSEHGFRVRITGKIALDHEDFEVVVNSVQLIGWVAFITAMLVLVLGLRSLRLVLATMLTLMIGIIWTATFATVAVGSLNIISIAFSILYIGIGVDYAIHYCLLYRERICAGDSCEQALDTAAKAVGGSLAICAISTSIGFYAFVPTDFDGVSELGLISGTGMFICLLVTFSLLPALLSCWPYSRDQLPSQLNAASVQIWPWSRLVHWTFGHRRSVLAGSIVVVTIAVLVAPTVRFDANPLNLRNPQAESVATYRELLADTATSPWRLYLLGFDPQTMPALQQRLEALEVVSYTRQIQSFVPKNQQAKLDLIDELSLFLGPDLEPTTASPTAAQRQQAFEQLQITATALAATDSSTALGVAAAALREQLIALAAASSTSDRYTTVKAAVLETLEHNLLADFADSIAALSTALTATEMGVADLPRSLVARWIAVDGRNVLEIVSTQNLENVDALQRFVAAVTAIAPLATGAPVVQLNAGQIVVGTFQQAMISALVLIAVLLVLFMGGVRAPMLVLAVLVLANTVTVCVLVLIGSEINFANVIALPLLFGMGIDNGIHMVCRFGGGPLSPERLLHSSTTRGVMVSALTTVCSFGSLAFSSHPGMASMGIVLSIGLISILFFTLVVLPMLLQYAPVHRFQSMP